MRCGKCDGLPVPEHHPSCPLRSSPAPTGPVVEAEWPATYQVEFSSTDDADRDAKLILLEDDRHTAEQIRQLCLRYGVIARIVSDDRQRPLADVDIAGNVTWR